MSSPLPKYWILHHFKAPGVKAQLQLGFPSLKSWCNSISSSVAYPSKTTANTQQQARHAEGQLTRIHIKRNLKLHGSCDNSFAAKTKSMIVKWFVGSTTSKCSKAFRWFEVLQKTCRTSAASKEFTKASSLLWLGKPHSLLASTYGPERSNLGKHTGQKQMSTWTTGRDQYPAPWIKYHQATGQSPWDISRTSFECPSQALGKVSRSRPWIPFCLFSPKKINIFFSPQPRHCTTNQSDPFGSHCLPFPVFFYSLSIQARTELMFCSGAAHAVRRPCTSSQKWPYNTSY